MLKEIFDLKQSLHKTRQELSMALHKGQSAVNTVCRLQAENEKLVNQIASNDDLVNRLEAKIDQINALSQGQETEIQGLRQAYEEALVQSKQPKNQQNQSENTQNEPQPTGFTPEISSYFHD